MNLKVTHSLSSMDSLYMVRYSCLSGKGQTACLQARTLKANSNLKTFTIILVYLS